MTSAPSWVSNVSVTAAESGNHLLPSSGRCNGRAFRAFVTAARGMLQQATAQKDLLVSCGMSPQLVDDLTATRPDPELVPLINEARQALLKTEGVRQ
jgi:hypothetical protein